jgi:hypothetical protein
MKYFDILMYLNTNYNVTDWRIYNDNVLNRFNSSFCVGSCPRFKYMFTEKAEDVKLVAHSCVYEVVYVYAHLIQWQ